MVTGQIDTCITQWLGVNTKKSVRQIASCNPSFKPELHVQFIAHNSIQTCSLIPHRIEIYTMIWRGYKRIGQTNRIM